MTTANGKLHDLGELMSDMGSVVVAYSGGVDSSFLAEVAHGKLGDRCLAVTASSLSLPSWELEEAVELAGMLGLHHRIIETGEVQEPGYAANGARRCYFCKDHLYGRFQSIAQAEGYAFVVDGTTLDDRQEFRPGAEAAQQWGVRSPLVETGFTKEEIRRFSHQMGLPTWDKPPQACLASRIPYGTPVTIETLQQIARAERHLRDMGFTQLRVRHHGNTARIELPPEDLPQLMEPARRRRIVKRFKELGYQYVTVDLEGYVSGSLNRVLRPSSLRNRRRGKPGE